MCTNTVILILKLVCVGNMNAQNKNRQAKTNTIAKHSRLTFEGIGGLIKFRHHTTKSVYPVGVLSARAVEGGGFEEKLAFDLEAERRRVMGRAYSNMIPPR